jgi:hypothetical protein
MSRSNGSPNSLRIPGIVHHQQWRRYWPDTLVAGRGWFSLLRPFKTVALLQALPKVLDGFGKVRLHVREAGQ